jgi:hypothetical protein
MVCSEELAGPIVQMIFVFFTETPLTPKRNGYSPVKDDGDSQSTAKGTDL